MKDTLSLALGHNAVMPARLEPTTPQSHVTHSFTGLSDVGLLLLVSMRSLFDLILYVPVNHLSVMSGRVFLG